MSLLKPDFSLLQPKADDDSVYDFYIFQFLYSKPQKNKSTQKFNSSEIF